MNICIIPRLSETVQCKGLGCELWCLMARLQLPVMFLRGLVPADLSSARRSVFPSENNNSGIYVRVWGGGGMSLFYKVFRLILSRESAQ